MADAGRQDVGGVVILPDVYSIYRLFSAVDDKSCS